MGEDRSTLAYVNACVEEEGLDYAMESYSDYGDVHDSEFHRLRKAFLAARAELVAYLEEWKE